MNPPRILVFAGSTRADSLNRKLARHAAAELRSLGADVTLADLRDYPMPIYDGDIESHEGLPPAAKAFKELVRSQDAVLVASPEYNGSFSALLKNTIDWISRPESGDPPLAVLKGRVAAIISASPGPGGGRRGLRHLRELLEMIGVHVVPDQLAVVKAFQAIDPEGRLTRPEDAAQLKTVLTELLTAAAQPVAA